ncbi:MAG: alpha/beta fold hydrolase [Sporichthyaceae bacterium]
MRGALTTAAGMTAALILALSDPSGAAARITWEDCTGELAGTGLECATFTVPLDHTRPKGTTIDLALSRIPATGAKADYLGPMLLNPGGPGIGGRTLPLGLVDVLPAPVPARYDLIGFDPRGVEASEPAIACDPALFHTPAPDYVPPDRNRILGTERERRATAAGLARTCRSKTRAAMAHLRTADVARDLDLIRAALGAPKLNYLGFSYGTYLGQMYASLFPGRVGRFVLSGTVGPDGVGYRGDLGRPATARAFEINMTRFFRWAAGFDAIYQLGADTVAVRARYDAELTRLRRDAIDGVGPAEWTQLFSITARTEQIWPLIAAGWAAWNSANTAPFAGVFSGPPAESAEFAGDSLAVTCSDGDWERAYAKARADTFRTATSAPLTAWLFFWEVTAPCLQWPVPGLPTPVGAAAAAPMLFVNGSLDAPTTLTEALAARAVFGRSILITERDGLEHAGSAFAGNPCVDEVVATYLLEGILPTRRSGSGTDITCERGPEPGLLEVLTGSGVALLPTELLPPELFLSGPGAVAAAQQQLAELFHASQLGVPAFLLQTLHSPAPTSDSEFGDDLGPRS